ncbi:MAG: DNA-directed RNA polymerase subunit beta, partial [Chloroflexi bacterium]|nr:DNA-directed RNA polymerase subunit beta [Chloroflexota bacterium]
PFLSQARLLRQWAGTTDIRICPIETPEGPNIGLLSSLASFARINPYGFIESPYRRVFRSLPNDSDDLKGRTVTEAILDADGKTIVGKGRAIGANKINALKQLPNGTVIPVQPFVAHQDDEVVYLSADQDEDFTVAQANAELDHLNQFVQDRVELRVGEDYTQEGADTIDYMDVSPMQIMSVSAALIPFLEHDDANRALMGSNMQRQAVPLLRPQAPVVGTGIEGRVARDSGQLVLSEVAGVVTSVTGREIIVTDEEGVEFPHPVIKFSRTNQGTCFDQRPIATKGDVVDVGSVLADSSSTDHGELALGQNVLVAFMSWEGYNYEDAIIVSERLYRDDYFTSIHIEKHEMEARETKLGPEEITRDIPNVGETSLRDLDDLGIIRVGADVGPGDILVGKVTPKGETELTAEEKLLRAIFGEKSRDVKDTSLRVPHGERGKVIDVKVLTRENRDDLSPGVNQAVRVWIAQTRKISVGDKMAGRHGNKGVVARILPEEDMPYMADGTPVDIILNPIGVPSRMNLGQVLETHLGWAARGLNFRANTPVFDGAGDQQIEDALARVWFTEQSGAAHIGSKEILPEVDYPQVDRWLEERGYDPKLIFDESKFGHAQEACLRMWLTDEAGVDAKEMNLVEMQRAAIDVHREQRIAPPTFGKFELSDGRSGENFDQLVTVGNIYILKLIHLVEDKIHARSTGPYSMITQQPLGGKAQFGGQRFGEMEVWALEAYSAAYNLQEVLTVKSDDVAGRVKTYEAIVKGEPIGQPGVPESFNVLLKELQSLGLAVELLNEENRAPLSSGISDETDLFQALETI